MDLKELRKRLKCWQRELNLEHWKLKLRAAKVEEIPDDHAVISGRGDHGFAEIVIHPSAPYAEFWLVHELQHLVLDGLRFDDSDAAKHIEEQAVNRNTRALCKAHGIACPETIKHVSE